MDETGAWGGGGACRQDGCQHRYAVEHGVFVIAAPSALHELQQRQDICKFQLLAKPAEEEQGAISC